MAGVRMKRRRLPTFDLAAAAAFRELAYERPCAVCGTYNNLEVHHLIPKRLLKVEGHADRLWDRENGMVVCRTCHGRHENAFARIPATRIPHEGWTFAQELGLDWYLERIYGAQDEEAA